jgi:hypothetical protein
MFKTLGGLFKTSVIWLILIGLAFIIIKYGGTWIDHVRTLAANPRDIVNGSYWSSGKFFFAPQPTIKTVSVEEYLQTGVVYDNPRAQVDTYSSTGQIPPVPPVKNRTSSPLSNSVVLDEVSGSPLVLRITNTSGSILSLSSTQLESSRTGARVSLGRAAEILVAGAAPSAEVILEPYASAFISFESSPVGTSFRENICTGYLTQSITFTPSIPHLCPAPSQVASQYDPSRRKLDDTCHSFIDTLSSCTLYTSPLPTDLSSACREFIRGAFSYKSCAFQNQTKVGYLQPDWRIYVPTFTYTSSDTIFLLDQEGAVLAEISL